MFEWHKTKHDSHAQAMAAEMEAASGVEETEIRSKIAMLRSVLDARPTEIAQGRARIGAALQALDNDESCATNAASIAASEAAAAQAACSANLQSIEEDLGRVDSMLRDDPEATAMVGSLLRQPAPKGSAGPL